MPSLLKKILIVEDEAPILQALSDKLSRENFEVYEARDGEEGLDSAFKNQPDLILVDVMMPKMNGMTMLKKLREDERGVNIPVIILTNLSEVPRLIDSLEYGISEQTQHCKNFSPETTQKYIKTYLDARLKKGIDDFIPKANWKLEDLVKKVKETLDLNINEEK